MPRAIQTNKSQNNTNEDEVDDPVNPNSNATERSNEVHHEGDLGGSVCPILSLGSAHVPERDAHAEDDENPYSLRCVVGGKIKIFKKDSRVWLHKSSTKGKRKKDESEQSCGDVLPIKVGKFDDDETSEGFVSIELRENSSADQPESSDVINSSGNYNLYRHNAKRVSSDISTIGDSDADLTYSEASTPSETPSFERDVCKSTGFSVSCDSTETDESKDLNRIQEFVEAHLKRNSDSLGNLDICNESSNNVMSFPTKREISRKIAPAIDIEDESMRESLLDYAVNRAQEQRTEIQRVAYFTRSASKANSVKHALFKKEMKAKNKRFKSKGDASRIRGYNLRGKPQKKTNQTEASLNIVDYIKRENTDQAASDALRPADTESSSITNTSEISMQANIHNFKEENTTTSPSLYLPGPFEEDESSKSKADLSELSPHGSSGSSTDPHETREHASGSPSSISGYSCPTAGIPSSKSGFLSAIAGTSSSLSGFKDCRSGSCSDSGFACSKTGSARSKSMHSCYRSVNSRSTSGISRISSSDIRAGSSKDYTYRHPVSLLHLATFVILNKDATLVENKNARTKK